MFGLLHLTSAPDLSPRWRRLAADLIERIITNERPDALLPSAHGGQKQAMDRIGLKTSPSGIGTTLEECLAITKYIGSCSSSARRSRSVALAKASSTTRLSLTSAGPASPRHTRSRCSRSPSQHVKPCPLFSLHYCCLSPFFRRVGKIGFFQSSFDAIPRGCMCNLAVNFVLGRSDGFFRLPAK
jgi:hypothetical protein